MELAILLEYGWVLLVLVVMEGLLAADNALVLAIMVKHLPENKRKKALFYGLAGAFVFRFTSLFVISFLVDVWQLQAIGALYLLFMSVNHIIRKLALRDKRGDQEQKLPKENKNKSGFWGTVLKVEVADIAFAVDSILAAVALAVILPETPLPDIGGMDGGKFLVIFAGGMIGLVIMRFAANLFVNLLEKKTWSGNRCICYCWLGRVKTGYINIIPSCTGHFESRILPFNRMETNILRSACRYCRVWLVPFK